MSTVDVILLVLASLALGETIGFWRGFSDGRELGHAEERLDAAMRRRR